MNFVVFTLAITLHLLKAQTTSEPISTQFALSCNTSAETTIFGSFTSDEAHYIGLTVPSGTDSIILSLCNDDTEFNTTLTLFDDIMTEIAYDDDSCNDNMGRSIISESITPGNYVLLLASPEDDLESKYKLDITCAVAVPTTTDFDWFMSTMDVACPDCPHNVTLSGIGNITIEECEDDDWQSWKHRRLWGSHHTNPWNDDDDDTKTWFKDCIETDGDRRRLWGYRQKKSGDGCNNDEPTTTTTTTDYLEEWYKDKCDLDEWDHTYSGVGYGHRNHWHHHRYTHWHHHKHNNDFLTEVCIRYTISGLDDCGDVDSVFLGICENNNTDFNSSALSVDDLSGLIVSINNNSEGIESVSGAEIDGQLGILVVFEEGSALDEFELCLGNVTVDADFNEELDSVDIGEGYVGINGTYECNADGLPCLNFFFNIPCPPEPTEDESCECVGGMSSLTLLYDPSNGLDADIIGYYNARKTTAVLCEFTAVSPGTEIECISDTYDKLSSSTYFVITYYDTRRRMGRNKDSISIDPGDCSGKFHTSCSEQIIGTTSTGCDDLTAVEFISADGSLCNEEILDEETASANLISGVENIFSSSPLKVLEEMDPYVRYSLIGIVVTFAVLTLVACYICIARDNGKEEEVKVVPLNDLQLKSVSVEKDNVEMTGRA